MIFCIGLTTGAAAALTLTVTVFSSRASSTGIGTDQRPWIVLVMAAATLGLLGLFVLVLLAWLRGTASLPGWARNAWWRDRDVPPLIEMAASNDVGWSVRAALGVIAASLPIVIIGATTQGMLLGWMVNDRLILTSLERVIALVELICLAAWSGYLWFATRGHQ